MCEERNEKQATHRADLTDKKVVKFGFGSLSQHNPQSCFSRVASADMATVHTGGRFHLGVSKQSRVLLADTDDVD